jgi:hypothetical protein
VGLCNPRVPHGHGSESLTPAVSFVVTSSLSSSHHHSPSITTMSDRKRAHEDGGPSSSSKKARRSVYFVDYQFLVLTVSFNSEPTVSTLSPLQGEYGHQYPLLTCFYNLFTPRISLMSQIVLVMYV